MSILATYLATQAEAEMLEKSLAELRENPELQRDIAFRDKLQALMGEYDKTAADVMAIVDPQGQVAPQGRNGKRRGRALKVYKNPHTGEVVETRGGNHKVLKAWKADHGSDTVEGWVEQVIPQAA